MHAAQRNTQAGIPSPQGLFNHPWLASISLHFTARASPMHGSESREQSRMRPVASQHVLVFFQRQRATQDIVRSRANGHSRKGSSADCRIDGSCILSSPFRPRVATSAGRPIHSALRAEWVRIVGCNIRSDAASRSGSASSTAWVYPCGRPPPSPHALDLAEGPPGPPDHPGHRGLPVLRRRRGLAQAERVCPGRAAWVGHQPA